ncbi:MAG: MMPL family transporter [Deltaproteobacteria bacterium]|nr:MMPL family transporter [Deltaproteobacteria bacterium]
MAETPELPRGSARFADFIVRRHKLIIVVTVLLVAFAAWRATRLKLKTDFAELLPQKDPAVVVLREMAGRINGMSHIVVAVESPSPEANQRFSDDAAQRIRDLGLRGVLDVENGVQAEREFLKQNKFLYAGVQKLEDARDRLRRAIMKRKNPAFVDLSDDDQEGKDTLAGRRADIEKKESELTDKYPGGYFATKDRLVYAVVVRLDGSIFSEHHGEDIAPTIRRLTVEMQPTRYHPQMTVGLTGDVMTAIEERKALEDDLVWASSVCILMTGLVIFLFYGRFRSIPLVVFPCLCAAVMAMAFAQAAFGALNASTAFLGTIIVGNGINYAIIQMARYEEERRAGRSVRDSIAIAVGTTTRATLAASLGAAIAYGSLAITGFRGFNQFGYIGGVGMIMAWTMTVVALPAVWVLVDRRGLGQTAPRVKGFAAAAPLARFTVSHPKLVLLAATALTLAAIVPFPRYVRDPFEYDFRKLGNQLSQKGAGATAVSRRVSPIFGRELSPNFVIADHPSQVEEIRQQLREQDKRFAILGDIKTINDFLPGAPPEQREKLQILAQIRTMVDKNADLLDDQEKADAERLRPPDDLKVIAARDLPWGLRRYFTEIDGTIGRPVVFFAREGVTVWDGRVQIKVAAVTQQVRLKDGRTVRSSGKSAIFAGMLESIIRDGPIATVASLLGVALLLVVVTFRKGGWYLVLGILSVGVLWMVGTAATLHVRVNFLNFIALPITFGINVDYGINVYLRYKAEGRGRVQHTIEATGAAVALCALTTIIGYGALLVADNQALRSFGSMAIIGEFCTLSAALVVLPAVLVMLERRRARREAAAGDAPASSKGNGRGEVSATPAPAPKDEDAPPPPPV